MKKEAVFILFLCSWILMGIRVNDFSIIERIKQVCLVHDNFEEEFLRWREITIKLTPSLIKIIKTIPFGNEFDESILRDVITNYSCIDNPKMLDQWRNKYRGNWSNGMEQFHLWGESIQIMDNTIQPVVISNQRFVNPFESKEVDITSDIGINVVSDKLGLTGWMSKENGSRNFPHLGFSIDDRTILWIMRELNGNQLSPKWFLFLEILFEDHYFIYGIPFTVENGELQVNELQYGKHFGLYRIYN